MQSSDEQDRHNQTAQHTRSGSAVAQLRPAEVRAAFLDLHQREYVGVVAFLRQMGASLEDAEDAVQEAFLTAWRQAERPGGWESIYEPRGWLRTVAMRCYYRTLRQRPPRANADTDLTEYIPRGSGLDHGALTVETEFVRSILSSLELDTRAVMAFHVDGFRSIDIARHLGMSDQKVRDLTKKGRKALKAGLAALREHQGRQMQ